MDILNLLRMNLRRDNKEIVIATVQKDGCALSYVCFRIRQDISNSTLYIVYFKIKT